MTQHQTRTSPDFLFILKDGRSLWSCGMERGSLSLLASGELSLPRISPHSRTSSFPCRCEYTNGVRPSKPTHMRSHFGTPNQRKPGSRVSRKEFGIGFGNTLLKTLATGLPCPNRLANLCRTPLRRSANWPSFGGQNK